MSHGWTTILKLIIDGGSHVSLFRAVAATSSETRAKRDKDRDIYRVADNKICIRSKA
jgi:hypothetical protein